MCISVGVCVHKCSGLQGSVEAVGFPRARVIGGGELLDLSIWNLILVLSSVPVLP